LDFTDSENNENASESYGAVKDLNTKLCLNEREISYLK
jgi:hypothetical protein